jgi:hypothetical protein
VVSLTEGYQKRRADQRVSDCYPPLNTFYNTDLTLASISFFCAKEFLPCPTSDLLGHVWKLKPIEGFRFPRKGL